MIQTNEQTKETEEVSAEPVAVDAGTHMDRCCSMFQALQEAARQKESVTGDLDESPEVSDELWDMVLTK